MSAVNATSPVANATRSARRQRDPLVKQLHPHGMQPDQLAMQRDPPWIRLPPLPMQHDRQRMQRPPRGDDVIRPGSGCIRWPRNVIGAPDSCIRTCSSCIRTPGNVICTPGNAIRTRSSVSPTRLCCIGPGCNAIRRRCGGGARRGGSRHGLAGGRGIIVHAIWPTNFEKWTEVNFASIEYSLRPLSCNHDQATASILVWAPMTRSALRHLRHFEQGFHAPRDASVGQRDSRTTGTARRIDVLVGERLSSCRHRLSAMGHHFDGSTRCS